MVDCNTATSWTEGQSFNKHGKVKGNYQPQIDTAFKLDKKTQGRTCMSAPACSDGNQMQTWKCRADTQKEHTHERVLWDDRLNLLRSSFCWGMCVDVDGDTPVLRDCSKVKSQWKRHGPPVPPSPPPRPVPGPPGPMTGRYHITWPLPQVKGYTIAGIGDDGYPDYFGNMNGEICPEELRFVVDSEFRCTWPTTDEVPLWKGGKNRAEKGAPYQMKRSHILQRAIIWVANHWNNNHSSSLLEDGDNLEDGGEDQLGSMSGSAHCQKGHVCGLDGCAEGESEYCPQFFHGGACCATIGNAWNTSTGNCYRGKSTSIRIPCDVMRPGDAISRDGGSKTCDTCHDFPHGSHIVLFRKWDNADKTWMTVFSDRRYSSMPRYSDMYCFKRKNLIEDVDPISPKNVIV